MREAGPKRLPADLEALVEILALAGHAPAAIDLNQPGSYLNWNVFTISVANLVLIAVMVAIFGAALLLPVPQARGGDAAVPDPEPEPDAGIAPGDERIDLYAERIECRAPGAEAPVVIDVEALFQAALDD